MQDVPKFYLDLLNQLFDLEKKLGDAAGNRAIARPLERIKQLFEDSLPLPGAALVTHDPFGEKYTDTRTDVDANIAGTGQGTLRIVETLKPIIYLRTADGRNRIVQRGVVIAE